MLNAGCSEGCTGWVDSEVVGLSVHAWSLVAAVGSVIVATIVVIVVLLPLMLPFRKLEPAELRSSMRLYLTKNAEKIDGPLHPRKTSA